MSTEKQSVVQTLESVISTFNDIEDALVEKNIIPRNIPKNQWIGYINNMDSGGSGNSDDDTRVSELEAQVQSLTTQISQLESENTSLRQQLDALDVDSLESRISELEGQVSDKDATITSLNGQISNYEGYLSDIYWEISHNDVDVACNENDYGNYDDAISDIKNAYNNTVSQKDSTISYLNGQLGDRDNTISELQGCLSDVYTAISANTVDVTCTSGDYEHYDDAIDDICTAYNTQVQSVTAQITSLNGYLSNIYSRIISKGGTCTENDYSTYADGVTSIPSATPSSNGSLDDLKSQLTGIDAEGDLVITNGRYLFANMPNFERFYTGKFDLSNCTDVTGMFQNMNCGFNGLSDFGSNVQSDLVLDLTSMGVDLDNFKDDIARNNTGYRREIILKHSDYESNVGWGGVVTLTNKGYIITDAGEEEGG